MIFLSLVPLATAIGWSPLNSLIFLSFSIFTASHVPGQLVVVTSRYFCHCAQANSRFSTSG